MNDTPENGTPKIGSPQNGTPQNGSTGSASTDPAPVRLVFVDDNEDLLNVFRLTLRRIKDIDLVATLMSADGVAATLAEHRPHVLLIDLTMDGKPPLDAVRETVTNHPGVRCMVYSGYDDEATLREVAEAGAVGFASKHQDIGDVLDAVRRVASGETLLRR
jgi:DNA-binding NarL/FixJ family response regulator